MVTHIARSDLPRTAWLQTLAYATTATTSSGEPLQRPRTWARAAWPGVLATHCIVGHRNLYLTPDRLGVVSFYKHPPLGMIARGGVFFAPLIVTILSGSVLLTAAATLAYLVLLGSMGVSIAVTGRHSKAAPGTSRISKPWRHYVIGLAAAPPAATRCETGLLARALMRQLPPGRAVAVHPRTESLRRTYEHAGFTPSKGMEMVRHI